jgi:hypothetical protein
MDATISYNEVAALVRINIPTLDLHPNFEQSWVLCRHFERALQCLPCPQTTLHEWKGMVMAQELYALLTLMPFCLPNNPVDTAVYVFIVVAGQPVDTTLLTRTEQATINTQFAHTKHYSLLMHIIERACFTALDASINDAFKVSNDPAIQGWHAGMCVINILDQLSRIYGQSMPAILKTSDAIFRSPYLAADAPKVLSCQI